MNLKNCLIPHSETLTRKKHSFKYRVITFSNSRYFVRLYVFVFFIWFLCTVGVMSERFYQFNYVDVDIDIDIENASFLQLFWIPAGSIFHKDGYVGVKIEPIVTLLFQYLTCRKESKGSSVHFASFSSSQNRTSAKPHGEAKLSRKNIAVLMSSLGINRH